jgi:hypothetical protein
VIGGVRLLAFHLDPLIPDPRSLIPDPRSLPMFHVKHQSRVRLFHVKHHMGPWPRASCYNSQRLAA